MANGPTRTVERQMIANALLGSSSSGFGSTTRYIGLYTSAVSSMTDDPADATGEASGNNYARAACGSWAFTTSTQNTSNPTVLANNAVITFNSATPNGWGTIVGWGVFTASSGGAPIWTGLIDGGSQSVAAGNNVQIAVGQLRLVLGNGDEANWNTV